MRACAIPLVVLLAACVETTGPGETDAPSALPADAADASPGSDSAPVTDAAQVQRVYAHGPLALYEVNPETFAVRLIGPFVWPAEIFNDNMTDIALDSQSKMIGISFTRLYSVDPTTAVTTYLADIGTRFNGLTFVPIGVIPGTTTETLVAVTVGGDLFRVDPMTGQTTLLGNYGPNIVSSGDLVSVTGLGTLATVVVPGVTGDWLARVDPASGMATLIGQTGFSAIWGVGFWGSKVYGFTSDRQFITIDVDTGQGTLVENGGVAWWGAGVTTTALVIQ